MIGKIKSYLVKVCIFLPTLFVVRILVGRLDLCFLTHTKKYMTPINALTHDRGGGEKKRRVFPPKAEFGASVASSFVPDTPPPPDGEGLGP